MPEAAPEQTRADLERLLGPDAVRWDEAALRDHSHDWWFVAQLRLHRGTLTTRPACVVCPTDTTQVSQVLAYANQRRIPVVPFGGGSGVCAGVLPAEGSIVVDLRRMDRVLELSETALTVRVQPGMMGNAFEAALNQRGYSMGHFPQSIDLSTVGGWVATRAAGQFSTRYGSIEDMLLALEAVLPDGRVVRTRVGPRTSTGPDLRQLFLGSEGTLGVVTELTLRIHPQPESRVALAFSFPSMGEGLEAIRRIMRAGWRPPVVRLYDEVETGRLLSAVSKGDNSVLLLLSEGPRALTAAESAGCAEICGSGGGDALGPEPVEHWLAERNQVSAFETLLQRGFVLDTIEVATTWDHINALYHEVVAALRAVESMVVASGHSSHSYAQGTNIYFTFVARPDEPERAEAVYFAAWERAMEATIRCHGTISHHHGIGRLRVPWIERELGDGLAVLRSIKHALDPHGIMNPGVLIPERT